MKISNSKKQLAKIIHENGGWRDGYVFSAQDGDDRAVWFYEYGPVRGSGTWWKSYGRAHRGIEGVGKLPNWHQTILSRDEYFHLYPARYALRPEDFGATDDNGRHHGSKPTVEQLAADYRNRKDYADRKQQAADAAKAAAEAKLAALVAAGKAIGLVLSVAEPEPELGITDWRDLRVGDEISVQHLKNVYSKNSVLVVGAREVAIRNHAGAHKAVNLDEINWSFIRRPARGDANA